MQFACMKMKGYYPAPVSESDLLPINFAEGVSRMRGTFALSSSHHPLEARQMVGTLGTVEVTELFAGEDVGADLGLRADGTGRWQKKVSEKGGRLSPMKLAFEPPVVCRLPFIKS